VDFVPDRRFEQFRFGLLQDARSQEDFLLSSACLMRASTSPRSKPSVSPAS
jgi:hypothetical protein